MAPNSAWPDAVDEIIRSDQAVLLATVTPASGVVLSPLTNFGLGDRQAGTLSGLNSSAGMWRKLDRVRRNPQVAVAFHTRDHGFCDRPEYVLVQGRAALTPPDPRYVDSSEAIRASFERFAGGNPSGGALWQRWLKAWHLRVGIEIDVARVVVWPDLACRGIPEIHGAPLPAEPPAPQAAPAKGTAPRMNAARAAKRAARLRHAALGWTGADGFPVAVPVELAASEARGIVVEASAGLIPPGGRRAGLTAHAFSRYVIGQDQRIHTGWLERESDGRGIYAPHTRWAYRFPESPLAYKLVAGFGTRRGLRQARRAGVVSRLT
jgi:hypothetical protein